MVKEIVHDIFFLSQKSIEATKEDLQIGIDLMDTLKANQNRCVGMAANMIGYLKRMMIIETKDGYLVLINPKILEKKYEYHTKEGCLSLEGVRPCVRYKYVKVSFYDMNFKLKIKTFKDFEAQIFLHEFDHFDGILI